MPENSTSSPAPDQCETVLDSLMLSWPEVPSDDSSSAFLSHLCKCRDCLCRWIALEAAADLALAADSGEYARPQTGGLRR